MKNGYRGATNSPCCGRWVILNCSGSGMPAPPAAAPVSGSTSVSVPVSTMSTGLEVNVLAERSTTVGAVFVPGVFTVTS